MADKPAPGRVMRALYDFDGNGKDELTFKQDDLVTIVTVDSSGWYTGADANGQLGRFPANYFALLPQNAAVKSALKR